MQARLSDGELDIRYVFLDEAEAETLAALLPHLDEDERSEAHLRLLTKDRVAFAAGRALVRKMLSDYEPVPPREWRLKRDGYGKPTIVGCASLPGLQFNISHCIGLVVVAVSLGREIGVDVESTTLPVDCLAVARAHFAATEVRLLERLSGDLQDRAFFALWTLKEAYLKAQGRGLSGSLSESAFTLDPATIAFGPESVEDPKRWFFWQGELSPSHILAIAAERRDGEELRCRMLCLPITDLY